MKNACERADSISMEHGMKPVTSLALLGSAVALALTQISVAAVLAGAALGGLGYVLMPRSTIQR